MLLRLFQRRAENGLVVSCTHTYQVLRNNARRKLLSMSLFAFSFFFYSEWFKRYLCARVLMRIETRNGTERNDCSFLSFLPPNPCRLVSREQRGWLMTSLNSSTGIYYVMLLLLYLGGRVPRGCSTCWPTAARDWMPTNCDTKTSKSCDTATYDYPCSQSPVIIKGTIKWTNETNNREHWVLFEI